jgi:hypothetical protein
MFGWGKRKQTDEMPGQELGLGREEDLHTLDHPYCEDLSCWCHTDVAYYEQVTGPFVEVLDEQVAWAYRFFGVVRT